MASMQLVNPENGVSPDRKLPLLTSLQDLTIIEAWDPVTDTPKYVTFCFVSEDEELFFGEGLASEMAVGVGSSSIVIR